MTWIRWPLLVLAACVVAFAVGVLVYLTVSFLHLRAHTERRPPGTALRAAAREGLWVVAVQPLLPLYYLIGRRMGGGPVGRPVILVHGYMQNRVGFLRIARVLRRRGCGPLFAMNFAWWRPMPQCTEALGRFIERVRAETGAEQVDLVCHSMGGVMAMEYLRGVGCSSVRRVVTVASPHAGIAWRGIVVGESGRQLRSKSDFFRGRRWVSVGVPVLSIASTHDNVVHPPETSRLAPLGGADHAMANLGHLTILFDPDVAAAIADHLEDDDCGNDTCCAAATIEAAS